MQKNFGIPSRLVDTRESTPVNWRRGLFRLWLLISAAWMMGWTVYLVLEGIQGQLKTTGQLLALPVLLFGPPVALLLFAIAARWAVRAFIADDGRPPVRVIYDQKREHAETAEGWRHRDPAERT